LEKQTLTHSLTLVCSFLPWLPHPSSLSLATKVTPSLPTLIFSSKFNFPKDTTYYSCSYYSQEPLWFIYFTILLLLLHVLLSLLFFSFSDLDLALTLEFLCQARYGVSLLLLLLLSHRFQDTVLIWGLAVFRCDPLVLMIKK